MPAKKDEIKYEYTKTANGFRFTFFRPGKTESKQFTDTDNKVLELLKGNNKLTAKQLSEECRLTERTINRSLKKLKTSIVFKGSVQIKQDIGEY